MIQATYTGTDGSVWDLRNIPQDGRSVFLTDGGLMGLGHGEFDWYTQSGPITAGQRLTGFRSKERKVVLPVMIGVNLPEDQFLDLSRRWWRANLPGQYGKLVITTSDGISRSIRMRFQDDGNRSFEDDPTDEGSDTYVVTYIADFPFWTSPLVRSTYGTDPGQDFYNSSANIYRAWTGTPNASASTETVSGVQRTNLSFSPEAATLSSWSSEPGTGGAATLAVASGSPLLASVATYAQMTWSTAPTAGNPTINQGTMNGENPVIAGQNYTASAYVRPSWSNAALKLRIQWFDSAGAIVATTDTTTTAAPAGVATRISFTATAPTGAARARIYLASSGSLPAVGSTLDATAVLLEASNAVGSYFSGNTPNVLGAPPFIISSSNRIVDATIANTGDVPAWGIYTFRGPFDAWTLKVNGGTVGSYALATGETLVVNTNPDVQSAILTRANGTVVDVTPDLPNIDWRPIPVGASVPLQLSFTGTGTIDVDLPALYYRGF